MWDGKFYCRLGRWDACGSLSLWSCAYRKIGLREVRNIKNQYNSFLANEGGDKKWNISLVIKWLILPCFFSWYGIYGYLYLTNLKKEDMKMVVKNIPVYIRIPFIFCIDVLMGAAILIDIGIINYSNKLLIMTSAIWGAMVSFGTIWIEKEPSKSCKLLWC